MKGILRRRGNLSPPSVGDALVDNGSATTPPRARKRPRSAAFDAVILAAIAMAPAVAAFTLIPSIRIRAQNALRRLLLQRQGMSSSATSDDTATEAGNEASAFPSTLRFAVHTRGSPATSSARTTSTTAAFVPPSNAWLEGTRMGNVDTGLSKRDIEDLVVVGAKGSFSAIISESVCAKNSPVATSALVDLSSDDIALLTNLTRAQASQLIYRAIHENQYGPARKEAENRMLHWEEWQALAAATNERQGMWANTTTNPAGIGLFDFECPDAKFLLFDGFTVPVGLGSNLRRWGNVALFGSALSHQRVFLYMAGERPNAYASCERMDLQCSFAPMSPCVITKEEMDAAPVADQNLEKFLQANSNERIIKVTGKIGYNTSPGGKKYTVSVTTTLPSFGRVKREGEVYGLARTLESMTLGRKKEEENNYTFIDALVIGMSSVGDGIDAKYCVEAAAQLFITRPNRRMRQIVNNAIGKNFPSNYDPTEAVGLPIRASDKCKREADCIEFKEYMGQLGDAFPMYDIKRVVLTSEDGKVLQARQKYEAENDVDFKFIVNEQDIAQGSGSYGNLPRSKKKHTKEDVLASTMTAWAFQLQTGHSFLNLCSNFHVLMQYSINYGCSMASQFTTKEQNVTCNMGKKRQFAKT